MTTLNLKLIKKKEISIILKKKDIVETGRPLLKLEFREISRATNRPFKYF